MAENDQQAAEPEISSFEVNGRLTGTFSGIASRLKMLNIYEINAEQQKLTLINVESRDMHKNPYLFFIITMAPSSISVEYSTARDSSDKLRRLFVIKNLAGTLSLIADQYSVDQPTFYQQIDSAIDSVLQSLSQSYGSLSNNYDSLLNEYRETKRLDIELMNSNKVLTAQTSALKEENDSLKDRLNKLESYSDESLMVMLEEWIETHNNTIDVGEFSKDYSIPQPRIEQMLNKMVSLKYIELRG